MMIRVSLVEHDRTAREILSGWIANAEGFELVSAFGTAEVGLAALPNQSPDVVLTDIKLPGLDGIEFVRQLKPLLPTTKFVMQTAYEGSIHIFNALQAGAAGYLLKQKDYDELPAALKCAHAGGSPMTSCIARLVEQCFQLWLAWDPNSARRWLAGTDFSEEIKQHWLSESPPPVF